MNKLFSYISNTKTSFCSDCVNVVWFKTLFILVVHLRKMFHLAYSVPA